MKMLKTKTWQHVITGVDGNTVLFGVNIFDYPWTLVKQETVRDQAIDIFSVEIGDAKYLFGALEVSNGVWDFYIYTY